MTAPLTPPRSLRIATIGKHGQVAQALASRAAAEPDITLIQASTAEADLRDPDSLARFIDSAAPQIVINAGAYNNLDRAETERDLAFAINAEGPRALARICAMRDIGFVHMSTDCVFDGTKDGPYLEPDTPNPVSFYGHSKLMGETAVLHDTPISLVVRVCWVFSEFGDNFVSKMISLARTQPELRVVDDQTGPPTYAPDIAAALIAIARRKAETVANFTGLMHLAAPGAMDRASMARAIMDESRRQGGPFTDVLPVSSEAFGAPARRPPNARLSGGLAKRVLGLDWTPWEKALEQSVRGVLARS
jgi:dTDP-4-dehydrorhamnose reductase